MPETAPTGNYDKLLRELADIHWSDRILGAKACAAIRALQAEIERLRALLPGFVRDIPAQLLVDEAAKVDIGELRADLARVTAERDEARGTLAYVADRLNEEIRQAHSGPLVDNFRELEEWKTTIQALGDRITLAYKVRDALREKAEALVALEKWIGRADLEWRSAQILATTKGINVTICVTRLARICHTETEPDLATAIRAALAHAEAKT